MDVDIFIPCFVDQLYPETGFSFVKILEKAGVTVHYTDEQTCCGQPAFNSGFWDEARELATKFVRDFPNDRPIVSPSGSCTGYVKTHYAQLFKDSPEILPAYDKVTSNLYELTDFLVNKLKIEDLGSEFNAKVTYHDSCTALREYGIKQEPRKLLANVKGLELIEMDEVETCCGFGGTFSVKHPDISQAMAEQKVEHALATGAEYITTTESSCLMNIAGYIKKNDLAIKAIHIADILASGL
jgi:L-lactate dehydrogenase complex protein LldE